MATIDTLPQSLAHTLEEYPSVGERNLWLFKVAAQARHIASPDRVRKFLYRIVSQQGWRDRDFSPEIERAVHRAFQSSSQHPSSTTSQGTSSKPSKYQFHSFDPQAWEMYSHGEILFELRRQDITTTEVLDQLFNPEDLLCLALDIRSAQTQPRHVWSGMEAAFQFLVSNPMTAVQGLTQDGRLSSRCHGNATSSRKYQVVEFDRGTFEEQASVLSCMHSDQVPLVLVLWSGSKSLHGWFDVSKLSEPDKLDFFSHACRLGADSTLWDPCKLVRMPGGRRNNGNTQHILDFHPEFIHS